ncbi:MAG TPA: hypothetical protein VE133_06100, partial [Candidatus Sulfotelmatobacter sp.]|nr:hypothetical protein [Candidatus Sulfotelmatobacter sp.]
MAAGYLTIRNGRRLDRRCERDSLFGFIACQSSQIIGINIGSTNQIALDKAELPFNHGMLEKRHGGDCGYYGTAANFLLHRRVFLEHLSNCLAYLIEEFLLVLII